MVFLFFFCSFYVRFSFGLFGVKHVSSDATWVFGLVLWGSMKGMKGRRAELNEFLTWIECLMLKSRK